MNTSEPHLSRRCFTAAGVAVAAGLGALQLTGCGGKEDPIAAKLPSSPLQAGPVARYLKPGVYDDLKSHNIWLYSDGNYLFALAAVCTHQFCIVKHDDSVDQFACPCHFSRFTPEGLVKQGGKAKRSLDRLRISRVTIDGEDRVEVDPTRRFREDENQWSMSQSLLELRVEG